MITETQDSVAGILSVHTPLGDITLFDNAHDTLVALDWGWSPQQSPSALLLEAKKQIHAYFDGVLTNFNLPLAPQGTDFQKRVWHALSKIPYGETKSYGAIAAALDSGARAVGTACGKNPLPIIIPCHRVLPSSGALGAYSAGDGPETKHALLAIEGALTPKPFYNI